MVESLGGVAAPQQSANCRGDALSLVVVVVVVVVVVRHQYLERVTLSAPLIGWAYCAKSLLFVFWVSINHAARELVNGKRALHSRAWHASPVGRNTTVAGVRTRARIYSLKTT